MPLPYNTNRISTNPVNDWMSYWRNNFLGNSKGYFDWNDILGVTPKGETRRNMWENNPSQGFGAYASVEGYGRQGNYQDWLQRNQDKYYNQYMNTKGTDSGNATWWTDFLGNTNPMRDFSFSSPFERGERPNIFNPTLRMQR